MGKLLLVCAGGGLGSGARYLVATWAASAFGPDLPRGTLIVNVAGSFLLALVVDLSLRTAAISPDLRLFLATGVLGGFTTYSSFNYEALGLVERGAPGCAGAYVALTVLACTAAGTLGLVAARLLARLGAGRGV